MSKKLRELQAKKAAAAAAKAENLKTAAGLLDKASTDNRDLTEAEAAQFDTAKSAAAVKDSEIERLQAMIDVEQELIAAQAAAGSVAVIPGDGSTIQVSERIEQDPRRGFRSFGEFANAVRAAEINGAPDRRLGIGAAAPSTYGGEATGADGGFLVPPEFSQEIFNLSLTEDSLLAAVDNVTTQSNSMVFPKDETTPWGTDGVRAYWQAEAAAATATKPKLGTSMMRLHKLMALVPLTEELLADTSALDAYLPNLMGRSIRWKTNEAILNGDGNGQPLGMFKGAAAVTVTKDNAQAANTLSVTNLTNMLARLPAGSLARAQWLITPDAIPALFGLTIGNVPAYLPVTNPVTQKVTWMLFGLPVTVSQHASAFSAAGDVMLFDGQYYRALTKSGGIETASSMHLYFDAAAVAFRAMFRVDGQPKIAATIAQAKGSNALSPFVQLGAR